LTLNPLGIGRRARKTSLVAAGIAAALVLVPATGEARECKQPRGKNEPPCNPYLAQSPWGASHRGSYAQGSSPFRGLESDKVITRHLTVPGLPVQIEFSGRYDDGGRVAWGSMVDSTDAQALFKVDAESGKLIDLYIPGDREQPPPAAGEGGITGAYNILDRNGRFYVPRQRWIDVYKDSVKGDSASEIKLRKRYRLPADFFCGAADRLVGATMTYDGYVALATERGAVGTIPRRPKQMRDSKLRSISINQGRCGEPDDELEIVSNSIAADERGGIYVVTSKKMRRFDHDAAANRLRSKWSARYNAGSDASEIRLGTGSGSTPSLMGTGRRQDRFVVITDGQDLMHVDLFWRGGIPGDWKGLGGDRSRRLACEYPVRFGDPDASTSLSEQSVAVRGYGTFHVNNALDYDFPDNLPPILLNALAALRGGDPIAAPYGAERIDWNAKKRRCRSVWANSKVSIPNGIPSISQRSKLAYGISQSEGIWGVRGLNWKNGRSELFASPVDQSCSEEMLGFLDAAGSLPFLEPTLDELPNSCENSTYAATEIGPGKSIWTGTFFGLTIYQPE
jgi:hypothetical protein